MERKEQWTIESNYVGSEKEKKDLNKILKKEYIRVREKERERERERKGERERKRATSRWVNQSRRELNFFIETKRL